VGELLLVQPPLGSPKWGLKLQGGKGSSRKLRERSLPEKQVCAGAERKKELGAVQPLIEIKKARFHHFTVGGGGFARNSGQP